MVANLIQALDKQIAELQSKLSALQTARAALAGTRVSAGDGRRRRTFTASQRAEISRRMKATWAKRRKASGSKG